MNDYTFSVLTPTYNRAHTLNRVFESLKRQTFTDFEWVVVDDGSTDETQTLIESFKQSPTFDIHYFFKENGGKTRALNYGFQRAKGDLIFVFDSDDWCVPNTLEVLWKIWSNIPASQRMHYSGISALKAYTNGNIVGNSYPEPDKIQTYIDRLNLRIKGDKLELVRRDICLEYPYPEIENEKYIAPSYPWLQLAKKYKTIFSNEKLLIGDYLEDGISKNNICYRSSSPNGCCLVYSLIFEVSFSLFLKIKSAINYYRFVHHGGKGNKSLGIYSLVGYPMGYLYFLYDRYTVSKIKRRRGNTLIQVMDKC